ncbi:MAG: response regulator [Chloroherpetonaceae bacterium]|nr:response regulator [Chloroherpetonaceae bacterium]MDW8019381.1 response regulator [Chloroherpetonaceae bacterium]
MTHSELQILMLTGLVVFLILVGALGYLLLQSSEKKTQLLEQTLQTLSKSEASYKSIILGLNLPLFVHTEADIQFCNPAGAALLGKAEASQVIGKPLCAFVHECEQDMVRQFIQACYAPVDSPAPASIVVRLRQSEGGYAQVELSGRCIDYGGQRAIAIVGKAREQNTPSNQIAEACNTIPVLASAVAYNFNMVFDTLENAFSALQVNRRVDALEAECQAFEQAIAHGRKLTQSILDFARPMQMQLSSVSLWSAVEEARQLLTSSLANYLSFKLTLDAESEKVYADARLICQLILNLVALIKSVLPACSKITIEVAEPSMDLLRELLPEPEGQRYSLLRISSAAEWLSVPIQPLKILEFAAQEEVSIKLLLAYHIVALHHGAIGIQREAESHLAFAVLLPQAKDKRAGASRAHEAAVANRPASLQTPSRQALSCSKKILVVDDEAHLCEVLSRALNAAGYQTLTAQSSKEALQLLESINYDVSLCIFDLSLPEISGEELFCLVHRVAPNVPILITSGTVEPTRQSQMLEKGVASFLLKPFNLKTLLSTVQATLSD